MTHNKSLLWTQASLATVTGGSVSTPFKATGVSIDSRSVQKGDLFIALKNQKDGHYFIRNAIERGAVGAVVLWRPRGLPRDLPLVFVKNTQVALEEMGKAARARTLGKMIAVTGSAGKTTTKEALRHVLGSYGLTHASEASYNNHWGVPLTLARMPQETEFGVFETGMNHAGELTKLSQMVRPHIAIITTIAPAHLAHFQGEEAIAKAKAEIFEGVVEGGTVILPRDNPHYDLLKTEAEKRNLTIVSFGEHPEADVQLLPQSEDSPVSIVKIGEKTYPLKLCVEGHHMLMNALAVLGVIHSLGLDIHQALTELQTFEAVKGRGQTHPLLTNTGHKITLIDESYNANPASMKAALSVLQTKTTGRRIAILGDMLELGEQADSLHAGLADSVKQARIDVLFLVGSHIKALVLALEAGMNIRLYSEMSSQIHEDLKALLQENDTVMVKASNGIGLGKLVTSILENSVDPAVLNQGEPYPTPDSE